MKSVIAKLPEAPQFKIALGPKNENPPLPLRCIRDVRVLPYLCISRINMLTPP